MSHDFERISASLHIHFCPQCKASFGCEQEDGSCECKGKEFNWKKPWCPNCVEKEECTCCPRFNCRCERCSSCECTDCREERKLRESGEGPYDNSGPSSEATADNLKNYERWEMVKMMEQIRASFDKDCKEFIGRLLDARVP